MVELDALTFGYRQHPPLFAGTTLALRPGRIYGLLGQNGAGKSTLLRLIAGLLFPDSGRLTVAGRVPGERDPALLAEQFVLSEHLNLPAVSDTAYVEALRPFFPRFDAARLERYLTELAVPRGQALASLSLGQQKKFLLAFGLASNAALLLLDEPTNGLDIPSKGLFRRLVADAVTDTRVFVISTHQVRDVESLIDEIIVLHEGRVLFKRELGDVAAAVQISKSSQRPDPTADDLLYSEPAIGGFASLWRRPNAGDGELDLELLFNAIVAKPQIYRELFGEPDAAS